MAAVSIVLSKVPNSYPYSAQLADPSVPIASEVITSSAASQQSTNNSGTGTSTSASSSAYRMWTITSTGNVWVKFGTNPTAVAGSQLIPAGASRRFLVSGDLEKVAIIDAP
jgi:hypothetical protein